MPFPPAKSAKPETATAVAILILVINMDFKTPSVRTATWVETTPRVALRPSAISPAAFEVDSTSRYGRLVTRGLCEIMNAVTLAEGASGSRLRRLAKRVRPRERRPETVPIGQPSRIAASLCDFSSRSQRMIGTRYFSGRRVSSRSSWSLRSWPSLFGTLNGSGKGSTVRSRASRLSRVARAFKAVR